jgi:hypothetical protein
VKVFSFIDSQKAEFDVKTSCDVVGVARSSYYDWVAVVAVGPDDACWDEAIFANLVFDIWAGSRGRYGVPRVTAALWRAGVRVNHKRVERVMAELGLAGRAGRRKVRTTVRDPKAQLAPDLVERDFHRGRPDQLWVGDLTYIPTDEGWLHVTCVLDARGGCWPGRSPTTCAPRACCDALRDAVSTRRRARTRCPQRPHPRPCRHRPSPQRSPPQDPTTGPETSSNAD